MVAENDVMEVAGLAGLRVVPITIILIQTTIRKKHPR
jgi:hypothetical protein